MTPRWKRKLETKNAEQLNLLITAFGVILILISFFLPKGYAAWGVTEIKTIVISVGCSLLATSLVAFLSSRYLIRRQRTKEIIDEWGLVEIFASRQMMNASCDTAQSLAEKQIDIMAMGLKSWRDSQTEEIRKKLEQGVKIRILAPHPDLDAVRQRTHDEGESEGQIRHTIVTLADWVSGMKRHGAISLKYYNALPEDFYFRLDDTLFTGPYMYGKGSQKTLSYEYRNPGKAFSLYTGHFETCWNDSRFLCPDGTDV